MSFFAEFVFSNAFSLRVVVLTHLLFDKELLHRCVVTDSVAGVGEELTANRQL